MESIVYFGISLGLLSFCQCICIVYLYHESNRTDLRLERLEKKSHRLRHIDPITVRVDEDPQD
jgi:hypothetical protein